MNLPSPYIQNFGERNHFVEKTSNCPTGIKSTFEIYCILGGENMQEPSDQDSNQLSTYLEVPWKCGSNHAKSQRSALSFQDSFQQVVDKSLYKVEFVS
jgi:hypothetical protein